MDTITKIDDERISIIVGVEHIENKTALLEQQKQTQSILDEINRKLEAFK